MENKKGNIGFLLLFFILIAVVIVLGIFFVIGSSVVNYTFDIIAPEVSNIGMIGSANMTEISSYSIDPLNTVIQNSIWLVGVVYMILIIGVFGLAIGYQATMNKFLIPLFFMLAILMILMSIVMSNIYQDIISNSDEISSIMIEHTLLTFLILHSPMIFTVIIFIAGIILFSGMNQEVYV